MIKAVLFDLDDTLYPERQFVLSGFEAVSEHISKKHGMQSKKSFHILKEDFENGLRKKNFDLLLQKLHLENENVRGLIKVYREHSPRISLYSDAEAILNTLKDKFKLGIITDGCITTQENKLMALGIKNHFDVVIINDICEGLSKKNRQTFLKALSKLKIRAENAVYVGDNPLKDFASANEMGIHTVRIQRASGEYCKVDVNKSVDAAYVISSLLQLPNIIQLLE